MSISNMSKVRHVLSEIESLGNEYDLLDGMVYDMQLKYRDLAFNDEVQTSLTRIKFSGLETITPTMASPIGFIPTQIPVDFVIFEDALSGTLQLVIKCVSDGTEVPDFDTIASNICR